MRMWMIDPGILCKKHLLGEHGEIHKHRHCFEKQYSIVVRITPVVQIEPESMERRHDEIVKEMLRRGYKHNSPYCQPNLNYLSDECRYAKVNTGISLRDILLRCPKCAIRVIQKCDDVYNK